MSHRTLPRELLEEFVCGYAATGLASADSFDGFLVVLTLPFEIIGQGIVERISDRKLRGYFQ